MKSYTFIKLFSNWILVICKHWMYCLRHPVYECVWGVFVTLLYCRIYHFSRRNNFSSTIILNKLSLLRISSFAKLNIFGDIHQSKLVTIRDVKVKKITGVSGKYC